jgi:DNA-binding transcriptional ArsR family regulator
VSGPGGRPWTFLTSHAHVLLAVAREPDARVQEIAAVVGLSERAALTVLADLEEAGYLTRSRVGRRTHYAVLAHRPFRHPASAGHEVDELLSIFAADPQDSPASSSPSSVRRPV